METQGPPTNGNGEILHLPVSREEIEQRIESIKEQLAAHFANYGRHKYHERSASPEVLPGLKQTIAKQEIELDNLTNQLEKLEEIYRKYFPQDGEK